MNDIERIWALPAGTVYEEKDVQTIINYYLKTMGAIESGQKPKKSTAGDGLKLEDVINIKKSPPTFVRRI